MKSNIQQKLLTFALYVFVDLMVMGDIVFNKDHTIFKLLCLLFGFFFAVLIIWIIVIPLLPDELDEVKKTLPDPLYGVTIIAGIMSVTVLLLGGLIILIDLPQWYAVSTKNKTL